MTTAARPAPALALPLDALLDGLADLDTVERPGEFFDSYFVRAISAPALVEAVAAVAAKITKRLPDVTVTTYVDAYTGPAQQWCDTHRTFTDADRTACGRSDHYSSQRCYLAPADAVTVEVRVEGLPMWGEWTVGGILTRDTNNVVVATAVGAHRDDELFAAKLRHLMGQCAHCNTVRNRTTTVLLASSVTGDVRPVGKTCLTEYTGGMIRVEALATLTSLTERFAEAAGGALAAEEASAPTVDVVALAARYIAHFGRYIKPEDYGVDRIPTAAAVRGALLWDGKSGDRPAVTVEDLTDADRADARDAIAAVLAERSGKGYILNLQEVAAVDWVQITGRRQRVGLLASLPVAAARIARTAAPAPVAPAKPARPTGYIGEVKERREFVGTIVTCQMIEVTDYSPYGDGTTMTNLLVVDTAEGTVKAIAKVSFPDNAPDDLTQLVGATARLVGTVKKHEEYKGHPETRIIRVKVTELT